MGTGIIEVGMMQMMDTARFEVLSAEKCWFAHVSKSQNTMTCNIRTIS